MTVPTRIVMPEALRVRILDHARRHPDIECCGLLIGRGDDTILIDSVEMADNVAADRAARFEIDPRLQFALLRRLRATALRVVGHYHSHPTGPAVPSAHDLAMAHDPEAVWVIVSPRQGDLSAFVCADQAVGFRPVPVSAPA